MKFKIKSILAIMMMLVFMTSCTGDYSETDTSTTVIIENEEEIEEVNEIIEEDVVKSDVIIESIVYSGNLSNINIHMSLDFYEDNRIEGTYYYDKYKEEIDLQGYISGFDITLYTIDNSEKFLGKVSGNKISGAWKSDDKILDFSLQEVELVGNGRSAIISDDENIYFQNRWSYDSSIYKYNQDSRKATPLVASKEGSAIKTVGDKIYYLNTDEELCSMDKDGKSQKVLSDIRNIYDFKIYKDRIYFTNESERYDSGDKFIFKLISVDLNGDDYKEVILPSYFKQNEDVLKHYSMSYIYRGYAYFTAVESGVDMGVYAIKTDGSDIVENVQGTYALGCVEDDYYFIGWEEVYKTPVDNSSNQREEIFVQQPTYRNTDVEDENTILSDKYLVYSYTMNYDDCHYISVVDLDGNILNEVAVEKSINKQDYGNEELVLAQIDDFVYFVASFDNRDSQWYLARFEALGKEIEVLARGE